MKSKIHSDQDPGGDRMQQGHKPASEGWGYRNSRLAQVQPDVHGNKLTSTHSRGEDISAVAIPPVQYGINKVQVEMLKIMFERRKKCETIIKKLVVSTERNYPKLSTRVVLVRVGWVI